ncbi:MAG: hypothetical protein Q8K45_12280 [Rubrivivax sp.]|nr:hypothetical protein [Rubrivivax sp.]
MVYADQSGACAAPGSPCLPEVADSATAALLRAEVRRAEDSAYVLDLLGRALVRIDADTAERLADDAQERAAIVGEGCSAALGLVSVPTTNKDRSAFLAREASAALQCALAATKLDQREARVSRLRRAVGFSARAIGAALDRPGIPPHYVAMLTLTYRDVDAWRAEHVTSLLNHTRNHLRRAGHRLHYVWVAELQRRGALHYHLALWLPVGYRIPMPDRQGWWPHGWTNICEARKAVPYLLKYMSKGLEVANFPKGVRIYGAGGLDHEFRRAKRWLGLPSFVKARSDIYDDWRREEGGGWKSPDGQVMPSEYERVWVGDRWCCRQTADHGRPFDADGPFTWLHRQPAIASGAI